MSKRLRSPKAVGYCLLKDYLSRDSKYFEIAESLSRFRRMAQGNEITIQSCWGTSQVN